MAWGGVTACCLLVVMLSGCDRLGPTTWLSPPRQPVGAVKLAGLDEHADRVVYVIDMTGQGAQAHKYLLAEVRRSVAALTPAQQFAVVLYGARSPVVFAPDDQWVLRPATRDNLYAADQFLAAHREQGTLDEGACWRAIDAAMKLRSPQGDTADVIYLVAHRPWADGDLPQRVRQALSSQRGGPRIDTIGYVDPRTAAPLEIIARETGGRFRMIQAVDVGRF